MRPRPGFRSDSAHRDQNYVWAVTSLTTVPYRDLQTITRTWTDVHGVRIESFHDFNHSCTYLQIFQITRILPEILGHDYGMIRPSVLKQHEIAKIEAKPCNSPTIAHPSLQPGKPSALRIPSPKSSKASVLLTSRMCRSSLMTVKLSSCSLRLKHSSSQHRLVLCASPAQTGGRHLDLRGQNAVHRIRANTPLQANQDLGHRPRRPPSRPMLRLRMVQKTTLKFHINKIV